jgi:hypothetical protein
MSDDKPKPQPFDDELPPAYGEAAFESVSPPPPPGRSGRGCLFYGCVTVAALALLLMVLVVAGLYVLNRQARALVATYTATAPEALPVVKLPPADQKALEQRVDNFKEAAEAGQAESITLTAEQINALIGAEPKLRGKVAIEIPGDTMRARVSLPLGELGLPSFVAGGLDGRYFNGIVTLDPSLAPGGKLLLHVRDLEVKGQKIDPKFVAQFQEDGPIEIGLDEGEMAGLRNADRVEVKDGKVTLSLRPAPRPPSPEEPPTPPPAP